MTGLDIAIATTLGAEALLVLAMTLPTLLGRPNPAVRGVPERTPLPDERPDEKVRGCASAILLFGLVALGILAALGFLLPWKWAKVGVLVAALSLPVTMAGKVAIGRAVDGLGALFRRQRG